MAILDFPNSPVGGSVYVAPNGITYTYDASTTPGVWRATTTSALAVSPGSISGSTVVGSTLTYTPGTATGGTPPYTYTQVWKANGTPIAGATGLTYTTVAGDAGKVITVTITATDSASPAATASATTAGITVGSALSVTAGSISAGTPTVGTALTYTPGTASGGTSPYTYAYVWKANGTAIAGATGLTYTPVAGDVGKTLTVTITATDSASATANATTAPTSAVVNGVIPTSTYNPSPSTGPAASNTVATGTWLGTADTLTSTGCIEFQVNAGAYGQGPTAVATNDTVNMRWKSGVSCTGAADATSITGTLVAASGGTNSYTFVVDTTPTNFSFTDLSSQALSTAVTSNTITIAGPNVETYLTTTGGTLTSIQASIGGGAFSTIPASGSTMPVQPGQTIQIKGTTGGTTSTGYTAILSLGGVSTTWTATTTAAVASITTPSITSPANGATGLTPALTLVGSAYTPLNGAGATQTSSAWEVVKYNGLASASISAVTVPPTTFDWYSYLSNQFSTTDPTTLAWGAGSSTAGGTNNSVGSALSSTPDGKVIMFFVASAGAITVGYGGYTGLTPVHTIYTSQTGLSGSWTLQGTYTPNQLGAGVATQAPYVMMYLAGSGDKFNSPNYTVLTGQTSITLSANTSLSSMSVGDTVKEYNSSGVIQDATGVISVINTTQNTIAFSSSTGTWNTGNFALDTTATAAAPTGSATAPQYTAITGSPFSVTTGTLTSLSVPTSALSTSSTYYARVKYATTNATAATSSFSGWSSFATASTFAVTSWTSSSVSSNSIAYDSGNGIVMSFRPGGTYPNYGPITAYTSTDLGATWTAKGTLPAADFSGFGGSTTRNTERTAFANISGTPTWVVTTYGNNTTGAVYTSTDNGATWTKTITGTTTNSQYHSSVTWNPTQNLFMYQASAGDPVYTSPDGLTWTQRGTPSHAGAGLTGYDWIYLVYSGSTWFSTNGHGSVCKSTTNGNTWSTVTTPMNTTSGGTYGGACVVGSTLYYFIDGSSNSYKTSDLGATWTSVTSPASVAGTNFNTMYAPPFYNGFSLFVSGIQGIVQSFDGGTTWVNAGGQYTLNQGTQLVGVAGSRVFCNFGEDSYNTNYTY